MIVKTLVWENEAATAAFAARLARYWRAHPQDANMLIFLHGDLGAGKTTLTRYILRELGVQGRTNSPTLAVAERYTAPPIPTCPRAFPHPDDPREWEDSGLRDLFADTGLKLVEWPEKVGALLPRPDWDIQLQPVDDSARQARIEAHSARGMHLLHSLELQT